MVVRALQAAVEAGVDHETIDADLVLFTQEISQSGFTVPLLAGRLWFRVREVHLARQGYAGVLPGIPRK
jgi:hypothetical protein